MVNPVEKNPFMTMKSIWQDYAQYLGGLSVKEDTRSNGFVCGQEQGQEQQQVVEIPDDNFQGMDITDSYTPSSEAAVPDFIPPTRQQMLSMFNERNQKDNIVEQMLDRENSTAINDDNLLKLKSDMSGANLSDLRNWQDSGMKIALMGGGSEDEGIRSNFAQQTRETEDIEPVDGIDSQMDVRNQNLQNQDQRVQEMSASNDSTQIDATSGDNNINNHRRVSPGTEGAESAANRREHQDHDKWDRRDMEVRHSQEGNSAISAGANAASMTVPVRENDLEKGMVVPQLSRAYEMSFNQVDHRLA
jgi:hypothetical protein